MVGHASNQRRDIFGKLVGVCGIVGNMDLGHASDLRSRFSNRAAA